MSNFVILFSLSVSLALKRGIIKMDEINVDCRPLFEKILES